MLDHRVVIGRICRWLTGPEVLLEDATAGLRKVLLARLSAKLIALHDANLVEFCEHGYSSGHISDYLVAFSILSILLFLVNIFINFVSNETRVNFAPRRREYGMFILSTGRKLLRLVVRILFHFKLFNFFANTRLVTLLNQSHTSIFLLFVRIHVHFLRGLRLHYLGCSLLRITINLGQSRLKFKNAIKLAMLELGFVIFG